MLYVDIVAECMLLYDCRFQDVVYEKTNALKESEKILKNRGEKMSRGDTRIKKNIISSLAYQLVFISLSFLLPRLYLENFGSEVNGVLSTIKQIFAYMVLLEAGVGLATTQALYKRLGEKDYKSVSTVLSATNRYYIKTGFVYLAIVLVIAFVYSYLVPTGIESHIVFLLVLLTALPALFSYFVQAKYRILMEADGRKYVINNSETIVQLLSNLGKVFVLVLTDSLVLIQLVYCIISMCQLIFLYVFAKRKYKWLDLKAEPDYKAISQKNSVILHQISGMVFNNTDVILISLMCDFKAVSVYAIYSMFFTQMQNFITSVVSGLSFAMGQMFYADRERFDRVFAMYETLYITATFIIYTLMAVFMLPLIQLYTSGINDAEYTNIYLVFLFVLMNLISNAKLPSHNIIEYAGKFSQTRIHAVLEMIINLCATVLGIRFMGICGAIAGTVVALLYRTVKAVNYSNKKILERSVFSSYRHYLVNGGIFAFVMCIFFVDTFSNISFGALVLKGIVHSVWIIVLYVSVNLCLNRNVIKTLTECINKR